MMRARSAQLIEEMEKDDETPKKKIQVVFNESQNNNSLGFKPKSILRKESRFS